METVCGYWGGDVYKNGKPRGVQRYPCYDCHRNFTTVKERIYSLETRIQALKLYCEGLGFRGIGRFLGVSNVTVLKWIRSFAQSGLLSLGTPEGKVWVACDLKAVPVIQIDEFWHFCKKNRINFGSG